MTTRTAIVKGIVTAMLCAAFAFLSLVLIVLLPLHLAAAKGNVSKLATLTRVIPLGIIAAMIVKIWQPVDGRHPTEIAYYEGVAEGEAKAARLEGVKAGARSIAKAEPIDTRPIPVYATTKKGLKDQGIPYA